MFRTRMPAISVQHAGHVCTHAGVLTRVHTCLAGARHSDIGAPHARGTAQVRVRGRSWTYQGAPQNAISDQRAPPPVAPAAFDRSYRGFDSVRLWATPGLGACWPHASSCCSGPSHFEFPGGVRPCAFTVSPTSSCRVRCRSSSHIDTNRYLLPSLAPGPHPRVLCCLGSAASRASFSGGPAFIKVGSTSGSCSRTQRNPRCSGRRVNPLSLGVWHLTLRFAMPGVGLATPVDLERRAVNSRTRSPPVSPKHISE